MRAAGYPLTEGSPFDGYDRLFVHVPFGNRIEGERTNRKFPGMTILQGMESNADQIAYWNGPAGQRWAAVR